MRKLAVVGFALLAWGTLEACLTGLGFTLCPHGNSDCSGGQVCSVDAGICVAPSTSTTGTASGTTSGASGTTSSTTSGASCEPAKQVPFPLAYASAANTGTGMFIAGGEFCAVGGQGIPNHQPEFCAFSTGPYQADAGLCAASMSGEIQTVGGSAFYWDGGIFFANGTGMSGLVGFLSSCTFGGGATCMNGNQVLTPTPRSFAAVALAPNGCTNGQGCAFFIGGLDDAGGSLPTDVFDLGANAFVSGGAAPLLTARCDLSATYSPVDGNVYAVGGETEGCGVGGELLDAGQMTELLLYPFDGGWVSGPGLPTPIRDLQLIGTDAGVYAIGGYVSGSGAFETYRSTYLFDPNHFDAGWKPMAPLSAPRWGHAAVLNPLNGHILIYGGVVWDGGGAATASSFEEYVPGAGWLTPQ